MVDFPRVQPTFPNPPGPRPPPNHARKKVVGRIVLGIVLLFGLLLSLAAAATSGVFGVLLVVGLTLLVLGLVVVLLGRRIWSMASPRKAGLVVGCAGLIATVLGAALLPATTPAQNTAGQLSATAAPTVLATSSSNSATPTATSGVSVDQVEAMIAAAGHGTALAALGSLSMSDSGIPRGYDRKQFGQAWADANRNGCDTRNDILARDLTNLTLKPGTNGCVVTSGILLDPYTAETVTIDGSQSNTGAVEIDHVVSLSDAWASGARSWNAAQRQTFANDPFELLAVTAEANGLKGSDGADSWLPSNAAFQCQFVARQIAIKVKYDLTVRSDERLAQAGVLSSCTQETPPVDIAAAEASAQSRAVQQSKSVAGKASQQAAAAAAAKASEEAAAAAAAKASQEAAAAAAAKASQEAAAAAAARASEEAAAANTPGPDTGESVYWKNCTAAYAAGVSHISRGEPGYRPALDGDNDGDACEGG
ncbi:GmrSD restriction endonuclease domain-containing protein [Nakamurella sp. GG22]